MIKTLPVASSPTIERIVSAGLKEPAGPVDADDDDLAQRLIADGAIIARQRDLGLGFQARERCAQFMGGKGREVALSLAKPGDPREKPVQ